MPDAFAMAVSQTSTSASFSLGRSSTGSFLPSSLSIAGSVVSYDNGLRKLCLLATEPLPPGPPNRTVDDRNDTDDGNSQALDLDRTAERAAKKLDDQREKQTQHGPKQGPSRDEQWAIGPVRMIRQARGLDQREALGALLPGHASAILRLQKIVGDLLILLAQGARAVFQLRGLLEDRRSPRLPCEARIGPGQRRIALSAQCADGFVVGP